MDGLGNPSYKYSQLILTRCLTAWSWAAKPAAPERAFRFRRAGVWPRGSGQPFLFCWWRVHGLTRRLHGFGKAARLGISGGQGVEDRLVPSCGEFGGPPGEGDGFGTVAQRRLGAGGRHPGQVVHDGDVIRLQASRLAPLNDRLGDSSLPTQDETKIVVGLGISGTDRQRLLIVATASSSRPRPNR